MDKLKDSPRFCRIIDKFILTIGHGTAWFNVALVALILIQVVMRYMFGIGSVALEEAQWHLYGIAVMFGISYAVVTDAHIRLDLAYQKFSPRTKAWVEIFTLLLLVMPMVIVLFLHGLDFVESSWRVSERSRSPMGLPWRWAIKSVIPIGMSLYGLAAISRIVRSIALLISTKRGDN